MVGPMSGPVSSNLRHNPSRRLKMLANRNRRRAAKILSSSAALPGLRCRNQAAITVSGPGRVSR